MSDINIIPEDNLNIITPHKDIILITANIINISLPIKFQHDYINYEKYISTDGTIRLTDEYNTDPNTNKRIYTKRLNPDHTHAKQISDKIQITWKNNLNDLFITTYLPRYTQRIEETFPGSYGIKPYTQIRTQEIDELRDKLLRYVLTQHPIDDKSNNTQIIKAIIKNNLPIIFKRITRINGQYTNYSYYPVLQKVHKDLPEDQN